MLPRGRAVDPQISVAAGLVGGEEQLLLPHPAQPQVAVAFAIPLEPAPKPQRLGNLDPDGVREKCRAARRVQVTPSTTTTGDQVSVFQPPRLVPNSSSDQSRTW